MPPDTPQFPIGGLYPSPGSFLEDLGLAYSFPMTPATVPIDARTKRFQMRNPGDRKAVCLLQFVHCDLLGNKRMLFVIAQPLHQKCLATAAVRCLSVHNWCNHFLYFLSACFKLWIPGTSPSSKNLVEHGRNNQHIEIYVDRI